MIRKIMQTAAVVLLTGVLAVAAVTTYVTVPDEPAADKETQAEDAGNDRKCNCIFPGRTAGCVCHGSRRQYRERVFRR